MKNRQFKAINSALFSIVILLSCHSVYSEKTNNSIIGQTDFSAEDRLAIHNVVYAYSLYIDYFDYENWFQLFHQDAEFYIKNPNKDPSRLGNFRSVAEQRFEKFRADGIRRRHLMSNIVIKQQDANTAHAVIMASLLSLQKENTELVSTIRYEGWFVKSKGIWKISKWIDGLEGFSFSTDAGN